MKNAKLIGNAINALVAMILTAALFSGALFLSCLLTACRYPYMRSAMEATRVPEEKLADFREELKEEMLNSGVDDAFIESILPADPADDFFAVLAEIYGEEPPESSLSDGRYHDLVYRAVEAKVKEQIADLGVEGGESFYDEETLTAVADTVVRLYQSTLKIPGAVMLSYYLERVRFLSAVTLAVSVLIGGAAFLILLSGGRKEGAAFRFASVSAFAAALIFLAAFLFFRFSGYIEGFLTQTGGDYAILLAIRKTAADVTGRSAAALGALGVIFLGIRLFALRPSDRIAEEAWRMYETRDNTAFRRTGVRSSRR